MEVPQDIREYYGGLCEYVDRLPKYNHRLSMSLQKLSKFSVVHLTELSCDIHDEISRRNTSTSPGHLAPRSDIHQKRNNARFQFGDLSTQRFGEMCRDVIGELHRRYPVLVAPDAPAPPEIPPLHRTRTLGSSDKPAKNVKHSEVLPTKSTMVMDGSESEDDSTSDEYEYYNPSSASEDGSRHLSISETAYSEVDRSMSMASMQSTGPTGARAVSDTSNGSRASASSIAHTQSFHSQQSLYRNESLHSSNSHRAHSTHSSDPQDHDMSSAVTLTGPNGLDLSLESSSPATAATAEVAAPAGHLGAQPEGETRNSYLSPLEKRLAAGTALGFAPSTSDFHFGVEEQLLDTRQSRVPPQGLGSAHSSEPHAFADDEVSRATHATPRQSQASTHSDVLSPSAVAVAIPPTPSQTVTRGISTVPSHLPSPPQNTVPSSPGSFISRVSGDSMYMAEHMNEQLEQSPSPSLVVYASRLEDQVKELEQLKAQAVEENEQLHDMLAETETERRKLLEENEALKSSGASKGSDSQLELVQEELATLQQEYTRVVGESSESKETHAQLSKEFEVLRLNYTGLQGQHTELQMSHDALQARARQADESTRAVNTNDYELVRKQLQELQLKYSTLNDEHRSAKDEKAALDEAFKRLQTQYAGLENQVLEQQQPKEAAGLTIATRNPDESYDELLNEHKTLLAELERQRHVTEQVREEAKRFLGEMRQMTDQRPSAASTRELQLQLSAAQQEITHLKHQLHAALAGSSSATKKLEPQNVIQGEFYDKNGLITTEQVNHFQESITELLYACEDVPAEALDKLHIAVNSTEGMLAEVPAQNTRFAKQIRLVMRTTNQLISAVRNSVQQGPVFPIGVVAAVCSDLSYAVCEFLRDVKIRPDLRSNRTSRQDVPRIPYSPTSDAPADESLHNLASQPALPASGPRSATELVSGDIKRASRTSLPVSPPSPAMLPEIPSIPEDSTVAELQAYLEEQTSETVDSIRELLSGIKADLIVLKLKPLVDSIVYYVDLMVRTTAGCMKRTEHWLLKDKGSFILQNLDDCCRRMAALRANLDEFEEEDIAPRPLKQRLAGVSFDMAKCTKELVKTVEDVSIKSELETIDADLARRQ